MWVPPRLTFQHPEVNPGFIAGQPRNDWHSTFQSIELYGLFWKLFRHVGKKRLVSVARLHGINVCALFFFFCGMPCGPQNFLYFLHTHRTWIRYPMILSESKSIKHLAMFKTTVCILTVAKRGGVAYARICKNEFRKCRSTLNKFQSRKNTYHIRPYSTIIIPVCQVSNGCHVVRTTQRTNGLAMWLRPPHVPTGCIQVLEGKTATEEWNMPLAAAKKPKHSIPTSSFSLKNQHERPNDKAGSFD